MLSGPPVTWAMEERRLRLASLDLQLLEEGESPSSGKEAHPNFMAHTQGLLSGSGRANQNLDSAASQHLVLTRRTSGI